MLYDLYLKNIFLIIYVIIISIYLYTGEQIFVDFRNQLHMKLFLPQITLQQQTSLSNWNKLICRRAQNSSGSTF